MFEREALRLLERIIKELETNNFDPSTQMNIQSALGQILTELKELNRKWDEKENKLQSGGKSAFSISSSSIVQDQVITPQTTQSEITSLPTPNPTEQEIKSKTMNWDQTETFNRQ